MIKNENQTITNSGLKDNDLICIKNISAEINEIYLLSFYKPSNYEKKQEFFSISMETENIKNPKTYVFVEIPKENFLFEIAVKFFLFF